MSDFCTSFDCHCPRTSTGEVDCRDRRMLASLGREVKPTALVPPVTTCAPFDCRCPRTSTGEVDCRDRHILASLGHEPKPTALQPPGS
jgi:hypothetical protein